MDHHTAILCSLFLSLHMTCQLTSTQVQYFALCTLQSLPPPPTPPSLNVAFSSRTILKMVVANIYWGKGEIVRELWGSAVSQAIVTIDCCVFFSKWNHYSIFLSCFHAKRLTVLLSVFEHRGRQLSAVSRAIATGYRSFKATKLIKIDRAKIKETFL